MKQALLILLSLTVSIIASNAQGPIGSWRMHLPFGVANSMAASEDHIYSSSGFALLDYEISSNTTLITDKAKGLSGVSIAFVHHDPVTDILFVIYDDSNIDLIQGGTMIINVSDIADKPIAGDKTIYDVFTEDGMAFFCTGQEVILYDLGRFEFISNFPIGNNGDKIRVNAISADAGFYYAATSQGIRVFDKSQPNLEDFTKWILHGPAKGISSGEVQKIEALNGRIFIIKDEAISYFDGTLWQPLFAQANWENQILSSSNGKLQVPQWKIVDDEFVDQRVIGIHPDLSLDTMRPTGLLRPLQLHTAADGNIFVADQWAGLIIITPEFGNFPIGANGPRSNQTFAIDTEEDGAYVAAGGVTASFNFLRSAEGFYVFEENWWTNYNRFEHSEIDDYDDIVSVAAHPFDNRVYFGSYFSGLIEWTPGQAMKTFNQTNSALKQHQGDSDPFRTRVTGMAFDSQGNLWICNFGSSNPIVVLRPDGTSVGLPPMLGLTELKDVVVDEFDQKWFSARAGGILVYHEGQDLESTADDQFRLISTGTGFGNLPNSSVQSMAVDRDGEVWVGTEEGIGVFFCAGSVLQSGGCDAQQIIDELDGFNEYIFETEIVKEMAVDGADRKWIGTTNGIWLISADGLEVIQNFNTTNSPLPANDITCIGVMEKSGEVFIGTELGMVSYRSDATTGGETHEDVLVFPNPVEPGYKGPIAIRGLVEEAFVKITDVAGGLIYEAPALGGQAVWDGKDYNGRRAKSGVYLVFSSSPDRQEKVVAKILVMN